jgi:hypothetical protein
MTDVEWSPYVLVTEDEDYDSNISYFEDNGHYGLKELTEDDHHIDTWPVRVANKEIYRLNTEISNAVRN